MSTIFCAYCEQPITKEEPWRRPDGREYHDPCFWIAAEREWGNPRATASAVVARAVPAPRAVRARRRA